MRLTDVDRFSKTGCRHYGFLIKTTSFPSNEVIMKLAVFLPNWIGDTAMAIPALRAMRTGFSRNVRMIGVARPGPAKFSKSQPWLDDHIVYQSKSRAPALNRRRLVTKLRQERFDAALFFPNSISTALIATLAQIPRRIGYDCGGRSWLLTDRLAVPRSRGHLIPTAAIDYYLHLAEYMGCPSADRQMVLTISDHWHAQAKQVWKSVGFNLIAPTVVINNNVATCPNRLWPVDRVLRFARKLVQQQEVQVLFHCGPNERAFANDLVKEADHPRIQSMGGIADLPLELSMAVLSRAKVVVSTDSGARALAVATNTKVVSLFGPTKPEWTMTYNQPEVVVCPENTCENCKKSPSRGNKANSRCQCMQQISVERVYMEVSKRLQEPHFASRIAA
jgi:heptosyltransferase II